MSQAKALFAQERAKQRLDGWFIARETECKNTDNYKQMASSLKAAHILKDVITTIPLTISPHAIFAGSQADSFARSYALINPAFTVEGFSGYCDPTAVFGDIEPNEEFTAERIASVRDYVKSTPYVKELQNVYDQYTNYTKEVVFFMEQVTGHLIPDFRAALKEGVDNLNPGTEEMKIALSCVKILADRYIQIARQQLETATLERQQQLQRMIDALTEAPSKGAADLYQAIQLYMLLWQIMCLEQAPNPFAFSVGNADRIFEPYRKMGNTNREQASQLLEHFLVFFNVGDRSWAISQNILVGGKSNEGEDLTNETTYALLDAYYNMNLPQPILSVKLHSNTPPELYQALGKFFFTPGMLTPSLFNDDSIFPMLLGAGIKPQHLEDYSVAGCQEPLIMGRDNGNTTNSWLNLGKILELTLTGGKSLITNEQLADIPVASLEDIKQSFYKNTEFFAQKMAEAANGASKALSNLPVPFLSFFMGCTQGDLRDTNEQYTEYNGSGCLIHGLSVVADSFVAINHLLKERPQDAPKLVDALKNNFQGYDDLLEFLKKCPKFGNNIPEVDGVAKEIADRVSDIVRSQKNYLGNGFRADWSSPSTHLLYGYWVGATPDGRRSREMLGYGVDPLYGEAGNGLGFRLLSNMQLPFHKMNGGYASHFGIDPKYFKGATYEDKGLEFRDKIVTPLFFNQVASAEAPFYLYVNVTTPDTLRKVLENPKKYAPSGVYIMRIHGTFVNFLDLSPDIQQDIIKRLDLNSTAA